MPNEEEFLAYLLTLSGKEIGGVSLAALSLYYAFKKINVILKLIKDIWNDTTFRKYDEGLGLVLLSRTSYTLMNKSFSSKSDEIFQVMKNIYDFHSIVSIPSKAIVFKLQELADTPTLHSNIIRFLDYYKTRNGIDIKIFLHSSNDIENTSSNIKASLQKYISDSKIHSVQIISGFVERRNEFLAVKEKKKR